MVYAHIVQNDDISALFRSAWIKRNPPSFTKYTRQQSMISISNISIFTCPNSVRIESTAKVNSISLVKHYGYVVMKLQRLCGYRVTHIIQVSMVANHKCGHMYPYSGFTNNKCLFQRKDINISYVSMLSCKSETIELCKP